MPRTAKPTKPAKKLTPRQVVDRIMDVIAAMPEQVADLPAKLRTRAHWQKLLSPRDPAGANVLAVLQELPAFTDHAPKSRAGWPAVFRRHMGPAQVRGMLLEWHAIASKRRLKRPRVTYWRQNWGAQEKVQRIRPAEHTRWLPNPHRGTTTFQRFQGEAVYPATITSDTHGPIADFPSGRVGDNAKYIPRTTLTYCRWPWKTLEPERGEFAWDIIDATLATAKARGQTAQLRFQPYTEREDTQGRAGRLPPGSSVNVPDWYWDTGAAWIDQGMFARNEPDSNDPRYLEHFGAFIRAFGARYDGHPDLESIDIAYAGFWGEAGGNATDATAAKLADIYLESFTRTQLLGMLGTPACDHVKQVRGYNLGFRADCFGDLARADVAEVPYGAEWNHSFDAYIQSMHRQGLQDAWRTAPVTMETCGNVATWAMSGYDLDRIIEFGCSYHMSVFMPKNAFFPEASLAKLIPFDNKLGYRFALRQALLPLDVPRGGRLHVELYVENVGIAPIYRPYRLAIRLRQGKTARVLPLACDIRRWLPGPQFVEQDLVLPAEFARGEVKLDLAIIDGRDAPCVWFAIDQATVDGWHPLSSVEAQ